MRPQSRPFARAPARPAWSAPPCSLARSDPCAACELPAQNELTHVRQDARAGRGIKGCGGRSTPGFGARDAEVVAQAGHDGPPPQPLRNRPDRRSGAATKGAADGSKRQTRRGGWSSRRTERVDDEPDAEDGGELQRHRLGRGCRPPSSRRRSAGWPPHLASCGAPATRRHIPEERAHITGYDASMSIRRSGCRCECAQVSYGIRRCITNYLRWSSAGEHTSVAVCIELVGQPVEDGRRLRVDALQNGALRVDQRRLRGDEEAAKAGAARVEVLHRC